MTGMITLYDPTGVPLPQAATVTRTSTTLAGRVVGFIDNSKPNFAELVADLSELLLARHGVTRVVVQRKRAASVPAEPSVLDALARECDLVVAGSGD
jgi:hypothetical protein